MQSFQLKIWKFTYFLGEIISLSLRHNILICLSALRDRLAVVASSHVSEITPKFQLRKLQTSLVAKSAGHGIYDNKRSRRQNLLMLSDREHQTTFSFDGSIISCW